jgi:hypothetical protein
VELDKKMATIAFAHVRVTFASAESNIFMPLISFAEINLTNSRRLRISSLSFARRPAFDNLERSAGKL